MAQPLFVFVQMEFAMPEGPPDGRYLLRPGPDEEPEHVIVIESLGARRAGSQSPATTARLPFVGRRTGAVIEPEPGPADVATTRTTVIDPLPLSAEVQARSWLDGLDRHHDLAAAAMAINRVLYAHRIATADPHVHEVDPARAVAIRAGWGQGEQVASGRWLFARELRYESERPGRRGRRGRSAALRPQERLAALLAGRSTALLCEDAAMRARLDLDHGRRAHAVLELDHALTLAVRELRGERREDLAIRIAELEQLAAPVAAQARSVLADPAFEPDADAAEHALGRLQAALRARTATGEAG